MTPPILLADGLVVRYGARTALKPLKLRFDGGALGLLGPNGAGKSSFLRAVLGLVRPAEGAVAVLGIDAVKDPVRVRANVGYMPERDCHVPGLSGLEFVAYCGRIAGLAARDAHRRAHEVLAYLRVGEERYRPVDGYSRGMKQKAKLAAALVHDPALLFLDEPTNGLDPKARVEVLELVRDLVQAKGLHVVLSSHLLKDVEDVCTDMAVLAQGELRTSGRISELKELRGGFVVRVNGDPRAFVAAAEAKGIAVEKDDKGQLVLAARETAPNGEPTLRTIYQLGRSSSTLLRHVAPVQDSLEDLFMRSLEER